MAFPDDRLPLTADIFVNGAWEPIATGSGGHILHRDRIRITRGQTAEAAGLQHARCPMTLDNRDGRFATDNPTGPYFGSLGLNVPVRVAIDGDMRFHGEFSAAPTDWDPSGSDVSMKVEAAGILRRLSQSRGDVESIMRRYVLGGDSTVDGLLAYFPLEDDRDRVARYASALPTGLGGMKAFTPLPDPASFSDFPSSLPLPTFGDGGMLRGLLPGAPPGQIQVRWLMAIPDGGTGIDALVMELWTTGLAARWQLRQTGSNDFRVFGYNGAPAEIENSGSLTITASGRLLYCSFEVTRDVSDVDWALRCYDIESDSVTVHTGTVTGHSVGRAVTVDFGATTDGGQSLNGTAIGHVSVHSEATGFGSNARRPAAGYPGENAADRIVRLCGEAGVPVTIVGTNADTALMGPQQPGELVELLSECVEVDQGLMFDDRDSFGLIYRTRADLDQAAVLELDYDQGHFAMAPQPVRDDQRVRNDVTVSSVEGTSARAVLEEGPNSVDAVGRYEETPTVNVFDDGRLDDHAGFRLRRGTIDQPRYPVVSVNLAAPEVAGDPTLVAAIEAVDIGDRVDLLNLRDPDRPWLPPETQRVLVIGYSETPGNFERTIDFVTVPWDPYHTDTYDDASEPHYDTAGSELDAAFVAGTDTTMSVATTVPGDLWTTEAAEFPFHLRVAGVVVNATACSGASSPQTFTVDQTPVNGVTKTCAAGEDVRLAQPAYYGL